MSELPPTVRETVNGKVRFTVRSIEALKAPTQGQRDYMDVALPGFGIRLSASGRKTWFIYQRLKSGRKHRGILGTYPLIGLADAREHAKERLSQLAKGIDPSIKSRLTFSELASEYLIRHARPNKRSWREDQRILTRDVLPFIGSPHAQAVSKRDIQRILNSRLQRGVTPHANRVLSLVRKVFNFGIERDLVLSSACFGVGKPVKEVSRDRVLSRAELETNPRPTRPSLALARGFAAFDEQDGMTPLAKRIATRGPAIPAPMIPNIAGAFIVAPPSRQKARAFPNGCCRSSKSGEGHEAGVRAALPRVPYVLSFRRLEEETRDMPGTDAPETAARSMLEQVVHDVVQLSGRSE